MDDQATLYRLTAFSSDPAGGNPAGVWIGDALPEPDVMQAIAREVGYSETAFLAPRTGTARTIRYYSPEAEVPFCGHATIASGIVLGSLHGENLYELSSGVGEIPVRVFSRDGTLHASLTSVPPRHQSAPEPLVGSVLDALGWDAAELDPDIPPARAYAGSWHLVLVVRDKRRLDDLEYDFESAKALMLADGLTTLQLIWRESEEVFHSRNPFPVGGVVEDPATGSAAAALGGYLRDAGLIAAPATITIRQGEAMGRPSLLTVEIPPAGGVSVTGVATDLDGLT